MFASFLDTPYGDMSGLPNPYSPEQLQQFQQQQQQQFDGSMDESGYSTPNSKNRRIIREIIAEVINRIDYRINGRRDNRVDVVVQHVIGFSLCITFGQHVVNVRKGGLVGGGSTG